jgi:hypothetical protein
MSDIVERLRDLHKQATSERSHYYVGRCATDAADEIERLRASVADKVVRCDFCDGSGYTMGHPAGTQIPCPKCAADRALLAEVKPVSALLIPPTEIEITSALSVLADPKARDIIRRLAFQRDRLLDWQRRAKEDLAWLMEADQRDDTARLPSSFINSIRALLSAARENGPA